MKTNQQEAAKESSQERFVPLIGNSELILALGFPTSSAFRQALSRDQLPIHVFSLPNRRGKFALRADVIRWAATLKDSNFEKKEGKESH